MFNGEIHNYIELRRELTTFGVDFKTESETEVLLQSYLAWGAACVDRMEGMWGFAIFDRRDGTLLRKTHERLSESACNRLRAYSL